MHVNIVDLIYMVIKRYWKTKETNGTMIFLNHLKNYTFLTTNK